MTDHAAAMAGAREPAVGEAAAKRVESVARRRIDRTIVYLLYIMV